MPSQPSVRAFEAAKKVLAKCMAYDPHFPGSSQSVTMAWAEHITIRNISEEDMLAGVTAFYENNTDGTKPLPATISFAARELIRKRTEVESDEARALREARIDARVEGRSVSEVMALPSSPRSEKITLEEWERRHGQRFPSPATIGQSVDGPNPLRVRCFWCKSPVGSRCVVPGTSDQLRNSDFHDCRKAQVEGRCAHTAGWHVSPHTEGCEQYGN